MGSSVLYGSQFYLTTSYLCTPLFVPLTQSSHHLSTHFQPSTNRPSLYVLVFVTFPSLSQTVKSPSSFPFFQFPSHSLFPFSYCRVVFNGEHTDIHYSKQNDDCGIVFLSQLLRKTVYVFLRLGLQPEHYLQRC